MDRSLTRCTLFHLIEREDWEQVKDVLVENPGLACEPGSSYKALPLTFALMHKPPLHVVKRLIAANPDAVTSKNEMGMLPLRVAIRNQAEPSVIFALMDADLNKVAVQSFGVTGKTCLHLACFHHLQTNIIQRLLSAWPQAASWKDRNGWYPLHYACLCEESCDAIELILKAYPDAVTSTCTSEEETALHLAALHHASPDTLKLLYEANPEAAKARTKTNGWLPLHLACQKYVSVDIVKTLLEMNPDAAKAPGKLNGLLPLHIATESGSPPEVIQVLMEAYPEASEAPDFKGKTPEQHSRKKFAVPAQ